MNSDDSPLFQTPLRLSQTIQLLAGDDQNGNGPDEGKTICAVYFVCKNSDWAERMKK